jgi:hypothetical protein
MQDLINVTETVQRIAPLVREHFDQPDFDKAIFMVLPDAQWGVQAGSILIAIPGQAPEPGRLVLLNDDGHPILARWPVVSGLPVWATVIATISRN